MSGKRAIFARTFSETVSTVITRIMEKGGRELCIPIRTLNFTFSLGRYANNYILVLCRKQTVPVIVTLIRI